MITNKNIFELHKNNVHPEIRNVKLLLIEYFDINKPGIEKLNISITANGSSDIVDMVVKKLSSQLDKTLLFNIVDDAEKSAFNLEISTTNESKTVAVNLTGVQDTSFDTTSIGVRFRNEDEQYVNLNKKFSISTILYIYHRLTLYLHNHDCTLVDCRLSA